MTAAGPSIEHSTMRTPARGWALTMAGDSSGSPRRSRPAGAAPGGATHRRRRDGTAMLTPITDVDAYVAHPYRLAHPRRAGARAGPPRGHRPHRAAARRRAASPPASSATGARSRSSAPSSSSTDAAASRAGADHHARRRGRVRRRRARRRHRRLHRDHPGRPRRPTLAGRPGPRGRASPRGSRSATTVLARVGRRARRRDAVDGAALARALRPRHRPRPRRRPARQLRRVARRRRPPAAVPLRRSVVDEPTTRSGTRAPSPGSAYETLAGARRSRRGRGRLLPPGSRRSRRRQSLDSLTVIT